MSGREAVVLSAGDDVRVADATSRYQRDSLHQQKQSGVYFSKTQGEKTSQYRVGYSKALGQTRETEQADSSVASVVDSAEGSVSIAAGAGGVIVEAHDAVNIEGSEIRSGGAVEVGGAEVAVAAAAVTHTEHAAVRSIYEAGRQVVDAIQGNLATGGLNLTVSLSYGVDRKERISESIHRDAMASRFTADTDLFLRALGVDPATGNLRLVGSSLEARNIHLEARRDLSLMSAEEYSRDVTENKSSSSSVGVNVSFGTNGFTVGVSASSARAKGRENTESLRHLESQVTAHEQLTLESGNDTTLQGAQARGRRLQAKVGGDLYLESEQDSERYAARQDSQSVSGGLAIGAGFSASLAVSASQARTNSNYTSVQEQTGLFAGQDGFDLDVAGHTDLKGAVIASQAAADRNRLRTGTLGFSDIVNTAAFDSRASSFGAGLSVAGGGENATRAPDGGNATRASYSIGAPSRAAQQGHATSRTRSAVSEGTIEIRNRAAQAARTGETIEAALARLSRDPDSAHQATRPDLRPPSARAAPGAGPGVQRGSDENRRRHRRVPAQAVPRRGGEKERRPPVPDP